MPVPIEHAVLFLALNMSLIARDCPWPHEQRKELLARLHRHTEAFTQEEKALLRTPLMAWYWKAHPRTAPIVAAQFDDLTTEEAL